MSTWIKAVNQSLSHQKLGTQVSLHRHSHNSCPAEPELILFWKHRRSRSAGFWWAGFWWSHLIKINTVSGWKYMLTTWMLQVDRIKLGWSPSQHSASGHYQFHQRSIQSQATVSPPAKPYLQHSVSGHCRSHQRNAIKWRFAGGLTVARFFMPTRL